MSVVQEFIRSDEVRRILKGMRDFFNCYPDIKQEYLDFRELYLEEVDRDDIGDDEQLILDIEKEFSKFIKWHNLGKTLEEVCQLNTKEKIRLFREFAFEDCGLEPLFVRNLSDEEFESLEEFDTQVSKGLSDRVKGLLNASVFSVSDISEELRLFKSKGGLLFTENQVPKELGVCESEYGFGGVDIEDCIEYLSDLAYLFTDYISSFDSYLSASTYYVVWRRGVTESLKKVFKKCCPKHGQKSWHKGEISGECRESLDSILALRLYQVSWCGVARLYMMGGSLCASVNDSEVGESIAEEIARVLLKEFSFPIKESYICYNDEIHDNVKGYFCKECPDGEYIVTIYC